MRQIAPAFILSLAGTLFITYAFEIRHFFKNLLLFTSLFATLANADYFIRLLKGKVKKGGAALAHVGFALVILGSLLSAGNKKIISRNTTPVNLNFEDSDEDANQENVMLIKNDTVLMQPFYITYQQRRVEDKYVYFDIDYLKVNPEGKYEKQFRLSPFVQLNQQMGNVPEPATRHYWNRDIFTHITYADLDNLDARQQDAYAAEDTVKMSIGDSLFSSNSIIKLINFERQLDKDSLKLKTNDIALGVNISATTLEGKSYQARPVMVIRGNQLFSIDDEIEELGIKFGFAGIDTETEKLTILLSEKNANKGDFVIMQAIIFPYINVLWLGCIIMVLGSLIAVYNRVNKKRNTKND
jgi:cytochrome c-type biogenesis protein CcmF